MSRFSPEAIAEASKQAILSDAEAAGVYVSDPPTPLEVVVVTADRLKRAWQFADENPGYAHNGDSIEYAEDLLKDAVKEWIEGL